MTAPYTPHPETDECGRLIINDTKLDKLLKKREKRYRKNYRRIRLTLEAEHLAKDCIRLLPGLIICAFLFIVWIMAVIAEKGIAIYVLFILIGITAVIISKKRRCASLFEILSALYSEKNRYVPISLSELAVEPFRDYYGYTEPNVVTKCFVSSDKKFSKKDVCLFWGKDGTLRLAADLRNGFLRASFDLGCYVFEKDEYECISAAKSEYNIEETDRENRCLLLKAENVCFILGKRAFSFLQKGAGGRVSNA